MAKRPKAQTPQQKEPPPPRQELKAILTLPSGLTDSQVQSLKEAFTADLIATLGGVAFLRDRNIAVITTEEILSSVTLI
ncbi:MAG: hypothetical protein AAB654_19075 [Acidobacteriota bacterium]